MLRAPSPLYRRAKDPCRYAVHENCLRGLMRSSTDTDGSWLQRLILNGDNGAMARTALPCGPTRLITLVTPSWGGSNVYQNANHTFRCFGICHGASNHRMLRFVCRHICS